MDKYTVKLYLDGRLYSTIKNILASSSEEAWIGATKTENYYHALRWSKLMDEPIVWEAELE